MANGVNAPFGLRLTSGSNGGLDVAPNNTYTIANGYNTSIFQNDPVCYTTDGTLVRYTPGSGNSSPIVGVLAQIEIISATSGPGQNAPNVFYNWYPAGLSLQAGQTIRAYVYDAPDMTFEIQTDSNTTGLTQTQSIKNYNLVLGSGNTTTGVSTAVLGSATFTTSATADVKVVGVPLAFSGSPAWGSVSNPLPYNLVYVKINNHFKTPGQVGQ